MKVSEILGEGAIRQFKKKPGSNKLEKKFRCSGGPKDGKIVSSTTACAKRVDPKKRRHGKLVMKRKGSTIKRKSDISKKRSISRMLSKMNARLMGKGVKTATTTE